MNKIVKTDQEWKSLLTEDEYYVTRQKGTEPPFSGKNFEIINGGIFKCKCCGNEIYVNELNIVTLKILNVVISKKFSL